MLENWAGVRLDTQEKKDAFSEACYASVYDRAFELTGDVTRADEVSNQVMAETLSRYAEHGLPGNLRMYLNSRLRQLTAKEDAAAVAARQVELDRSIREETKFDDAKTALWLPGEKFDNAALEEARAKANARPKSETNPRSVRLTIFNTILFLGMVAAAVFLAYELGVRYDLI